MVQGKKTGDTYNQLSFVCDSFGNCIITQKKEKNKRIMKKWFVYSFHR